MTSAYSAGRPVRERCRDRRSCGRNAGKSGTAGNTWNLVADATSPMTAHWQQPAGWHRVSLAVRRHCPYTTLSAERNRKSRRSYTVIERRALRSAARRASVASREREVFPFCWLRDLELQPWQVVVSSPPRSPPHRRSVAGSSGPPVTSIHPGRSAAPIRIRRVVGVQLRACCRAQRSVGEGRGARPESGARPRRDRQPDRQQITVEGNARPARFSRSGRCI